MFGKKTLCLVVGSAMLVPVSADAALVAHYALDEVAGATAADSAGSNDGAIGGGDLTVAGILGTGIGFTDAAGDGVTASPLITGNDARSISVWFDATALATQGRIIGSGTGAASQFDITLEGDGIGLRYGNGNMFWSGGGIDLLDGFHHVAVTYDGTTLVADSALLVYIDGVLQTRDGGNNGNSGQVLTTAADQFWIGRDVSGGNAFDGTIDEVRVYDHALSQGEVTALANVPEPGSLALLGLGGLALLRRRRA